MFLMMLLYVPRSVSTVILINFNSFFLFNTNQSYHSFYFPCGRAVSSWRIIHKRLSMSTSLVTFALLPVTTAAVVGISHSMALSVVSPGRIDGAYYMATAAGKNLYRHRQIEGHCNNIHKGRVRVGFWVGNWLATDAYTGWTTMSRIFIEEVARAQQ